MGRQQRGVLVVAALSMGCLLVYLWIGAAQGRVKVVAEVEVLRLFMAEVAHCVESKGMGLKVEVEDECRLVVRYPEGTNSSWYNRQMKKVEATHFRFDVCNTLVVWERYRNVTSLVTREYLDCRPDGWLEYAAKRVAQLGQDKCYNRSLCEEELRLVVPAEPPYRPRHFNSCAVVGNSGDLLNAELGREIDEHEVVVRENEAPVNERYAKHVGRKRSFRLVGRGVARNMLEVMDGSPDEVLVIKSLIHRDLNAKIVKLPNPVYLFQGLVFRRGAKGTGIKAVELAVSMCANVDIYGFTVDPGYSNWTRYFSDPRAGHNPLQGRAYYQLLECLGVFRIHSPMRQRQRQQQHHNGSVLPSRTSIHRAYAAATSFKAAGPGVFGACHIWATKTPSPSSSCTTTTEPQTDANPNAVSFYKLDGNKLDQLLCVSHVSR